MVYSYTLSIMIYQPTVVGLVSDLDFATLLEEATRDAGGHWYQATNPDTLYSQIERHFPVLILIDLEADGDWRKLVKYCKWLPHLRQIPIYGFGSVPDERLVEELGVDQIWDKDSFTKWAETIPQAISPPIRYPDGWDESLSEAALAGLAEFNAGEYFEQHELLEEAWRAEARPIRDLYQGILQVGVAFLQIQRNNYPGTIKIFRRGLPKLRGLPPVCQGVHVAEFLTIAEELHAEISALEPKQLVDFDQTRFPKITYENILQ